MTVFNNILLFLTELLFSSLILITLLRIFLDIFRANLHNPICHFIRSATNPLVLPLRTILPKSIVIYAPIVILLIIECIKFMILGLLAKGILFPVILVALLTISDIIQQSFDLFFYAIIIRVILSWISPLQHNSFTEVLYILTEPLLKLIRRIIPLISGVDFSPLVALLALQIAAIIIMSLLPNAIY